MEREKRKPQNNQGEEENKQQNQNQQQPQSQDETEGPNISKMKPVTRNAYGGGMYAPEEPGSGGPAPGPSAAEAQSADGPGEAGLPHEPPKRPPPPSSGDRDIDITGQSYIQ